MLTLAACLGLFNHLVLKLPFAIGLLVSGLLASLIVVTADYIVPDIHLAAQAKAMVEDLDFPNTVLNGMLALLLFAGALQTDLSKLKERLVTIVSLASVGVVISAVVAGFLGYATLQLIGIEVPLIWCLAFGALISPTDPIAVLGVMKAANAPKSLETKVIGESLFNDGTGVILFTIFVGIGAAFMQGGEAAVGEAVSTAAVVRLLVQEIVGGIGLGLIAGYICYLGMRRIDEPNLEVMMTVATVFVIGSLSLKLHLSGPLAAVSAGLLIGNRGRLKAMSEETANAIDVVWHFVDEMLNAVLFLLIGLEVFAIDGSSLYLLAGAVMILPVLAARFVGVAVPIATLRKLGHRLDAGTIRMLTWGGLKGGVSVALAMKLPAFDGRSVVLTMTYIIVVFSIIVQGLTVGKLIRRLYPSGMAPDAA
jgi:CPA1 family monovalent cation:H+ antiporter